MATTPRQRLPRVVFGVDLAIVRPAVQITHSEVESRRFGLRVLRAVLDDVDPDTLREALVAAHADIAICRMQALLLSRLARLEGLGMPVLVADTLVHYERDLLPPLGAPRNTDLEYVEGNEADGGHVRRLVEEAFPGYASHYASNPVLDRQGILEGYVEWAVGYLDGAPERRVWLARRAGKPVALATCRYEGDTVEGVLYGVLPEVKGQGIYRDLIRFTAADAARRGHTRMHVSTQVYNFAVQKVWVDEGFVMRSAQVTFHVNALLDSSSPGAVAADLSAGHDPGWVDREVRLCFAEALPGRAEAVVGLRQWSSSQPLSPGERCRLRVGFPATGGVGPAAVVQVNDEAGALRHLAYYALAPATGEHDGR